MGDDEIALESPAEVAEAISEEALEAAPEPTGTAPAPSDEQEPADALDEPLEPVLDVPDVPDEGYRIGSSHPFRYPSHYDLNPAERF